MLTDERIKHSARQAVLDSTPSQALGDIVEAGIRLATEPEDRVGQYFVDASDPTCWFGPVTKLVPDGHNGEQSHDNIPWCIYEKWITGGTKLRIPSPPAKALDDMTGWQCREPALDEDWYLEGTLWDAGGKWVRPVNDPDFGRRRWIPPQTAKPVEHSCENCGNCGTPACDPPCSQCRMTHPDLWRPQAEKPAKPVWPEGPYTVADGNMVRDKGGHAICAADSKINANAIAHALTGYRDAIAWIRRHTGPGIPLSEWEAYLAERDALIDAADGRDMGQK